MVCALPLYNKNFNLSPTIYYDMIPFPESLVKNHLLAQNFLNAKWKLAALPHYKRSPLHLFHMAYFSSIFAQAITADSPIFKIFFCLKDFEKFYDIIVDRTS